MSKIILCNSLLSHLKAFEEITTNLLTKLKE